MTEMADKKDEELKAEELDTKEKDETREEKGGRAKKLWKKLSFRAKFWLVILLLFVVSLPGYLLGLTVRTYEVKDERIHGSLRIALITDLHSCNYGKGQSKLLSAIEEQHPDVILLGGDIFDDKLSDEKAEEFLSGIAGKYPCYYVTGNHEYWAGKDALIEKTGILMKYQIPWLAGDSVLLDTGAGTVRLCGVDDPDSVLAPILGNYDMEFAELRDSISNEEFTILLTHRPERFDAYIQEGFDLVLAGHAHGGQVRIPGIMNGFYAPNQGLFPKYAGGRYEKDGTIMIVSRGLAKESTPFPRFCNPPEIVIINLSGK